MARESGQFPSPSKLVVILAFTLLIPVAQASILSVGATLPPSPLAPSGTVLASITNGTITTATFTVIYSTWVYADPTNTFCAGCLDFVYQFKNLGPDVNERYTMYNFGSVSVDAGTNPFGVHDPITVSRSVMGNGAVVSFNFDQFGDEMQPGQTSVLLVIDTNATRYVPGFTSVQDGTADYGAAFAPTVVPEPASLALLGGGLLAIGGALRARRFAGKK